VLVRRLKERAKDTADGAPQPEPSYLRELNEAYQHFFFHYSATPLLVVETSQLDLATSDAAVDDLLRQIRSLNRGTRYYVPRTSL
jgi:deoxyadenosine/deoxycytidine kinase